MLDALDAREPADGSGMAIEARPVPSPAPTTTSGAFAEGGTFISELTERMPETRSTSQLISSAAASSAKATAGHPAWQMRPSRPPSPAICAQSSSVMNGMNGCSSL